MIISITLGKAYYYQGFFNIKIAYNHLIAGNGEPIKIQLGINGVIIEKLINRTASPNGTPRIIAGIQYSQWIQTNYKLGDQMRVQIVSQNFIILFAKGE